MEGGENPPTWVTFGNWYDRLYNNTATKLSLIKIKEHRDSILLLSILPS